MEGIISGLLSSGGGQFGIVFAVLLGLLYLTHWLTKFVTEIKAEHGIFKSTVAGIKEDSEVMQKDLSYIKGSLEFMMKHFTDGFSNHKSPLAMTNSGAAFVSTKQLDKMVNDNWDKIKTLIVNAGNNNIYDIQQYCYKELSYDLSAFFAEEEVEALKSVSYTEGLALMSLIRLITIIIRDRFIIENNLENNGNKTNTP